MASLFLNRNAYRENFILVALILFKSTQASVLAFTPETTVLAFFYAFWIFYKRRLKFDREILVIIFIYISLNIFYLFTFGKNDFILSFYILIKLIYAYFTIKIVRASFFSIFEKILYNLSIISLFLFLIQLWNYEFLFSIIGWLQNNISYLEYRNDRFANLFVFTLESHGSIFRNSGFAWEPKGFANFLVLATIINLLSNNFKVNRRLIIFVIALISTTSTTGFLILFIILPIFFMLNSDKSKSVVILSFLVLNIFIAFSLDLGYEKIKKEILGRNEYIELLEDTREFEARSLGRFPSFIVDFKDFLRRPIFGYGFNPDQRTQSEFTKLVRVNGLSDLLVTYGIFGFGLICIANYKSFKKYLSYYRVKGGVFIMLMLIFIYFASNLTSHPFWMMFYFLFLIKFNKNELFVLNKIVFHEKSSNTSLYRSEERS